MSAKESQTVELPGDRADEAGVLNEPTLTDGERLILEQLTKLNATMDAIKNKVVNSTYI